MSTKEQPLGYVVVVGDAGNVHTEAVWSERRLAWEALVESWPIKEEKGVTYVYLPEKAAKFRKATPLACLYTAVGTYMESLLGRKLDLADHDFFDSHPLTGKEGVSQPNTLRVVHELTEPYGVCISKVRAAPGTMLSGDLAQWVKVLGMNPLAMANRQTSNKEFCAATGLPQEDADRMFRFEFSEEPLRPAIVCGTYKEGKDGKVVVGHASYESPRAEPLGHILQFQLNHRDKVNWDKEPVLAPIITPNSDRALSIYECLDSEGKPLYSHMTSTRGSLHAGTTASGETTMVHQQPKQLSIPGPVGLSNNSRKQIRTCYTCYSETGDRVGANLCIRCWALFLKGIHCGACGNWLTAETFTSHLSGLYRKGSDWFLSVRCGWCQEKNELMCLPGTAANVIQKAIRGEEDGFVTGSSRRTQNTR